VLGLVKAQQVKNAVIVPVGSKGGFYPKQLPPGRIATLHGRGDRAPTRQFLTGLLDITDNLVEGQGGPATAGVVPSVDGDDPYLVVAADKGTATFSDIANGISQRERPLAGDAFASGGSAGYDHKKMGITAKGAWEAVKRHFREMGKDIQTEPFTVIGVGDMSGDVFGNGMLLSPRSADRRVQPHAHLPRSRTPIRRSQLAERQRMFELPRSPGRTTTRS
jgi:glutamate dehydrogenase